MVRGKRKLYTSLMESSVDAVIGSQSKRNECLEARRCKMASRYYFHAHVRRLRYDDSLLNLHKEFDLMPDTIIKELDKSYDHIKQLIDGKVTTAELRKQYPYFNWTASLV